MEFKTVAFRVMAHTGALRAALDRVERAALELAQAVAALEEVQIGISLGDARPAGPQGRTAARSCSGAAGDGSEDEAAEAASQDKNP